MLILRWIFPCRRLSLCTSIYCRVELGTMCMIHHARSTKRRQATSTAHRLSGTSAPSVICARNFLWIYHICNPCVNMILLPRGPTKMSHLIEPREYVRVETEGCSCSASEVRNELPLQSSFADVACGNKRKMPLSSECSVWDKTDSSSSSSYSSRPSCSSDTYDSRSNASTTKDEKRHRENWFAITPLPKRKLLAWEM